MDFFFLFADENILICFVLFVIGIKTHELMPIDADWCWLMPIENLFVEKNSRIMKNILI